MIVTVTPNPAVDVTYQLPEVRLGATLRPERVTQRAGGKGVNVARVLHALGEPVVALGIAGGTTGAELTGELSVAGIEHRFVPIADACRRTVSLVSTRDGSATIVNESGPRVLEAEWRALCAALSEELERASVLVVSGSLPRAVATDGCAELLRLAETAGVPAILDSSGAALTEGLAGNPRMVKPNEDELAALPGSPSAGELSVRAGCAVVSSLGAEGLLGVDAEGSWRAWPPETVHGNPIGAGDACVAALARGMAGGASLAETLPDAVALSAAAVRAPLAGDVDLAYYRSIRADIEVRMEAECR